MVRFYSSISAFSEFVGDLSNKFVSKYEAQMGISRLVTSDRFESAMKYPSKLEQKFP